MHTQVSHRAPARPRRLPARPRPLSLHASRPSDAELMALAQAGDMRALGRLLDRHHGAIERICRRMCKGDESYDDVLQETYLGIVRHIRSFRGDSAFLTWVYTIARTFRGRHLRKAARHQGRLDELAATVVPGHRDFEHLVAGHQLGMAIDAALRTLSDVDRSILLLRDAEGMSAAEVAARTGLTVPAVKTRLHRARVAVREQLAGLHDELAGRGMDATAA